MWKEPYSLMGSQDALATDITGKSCYAAKFGWEPDSVLHVCRLRHVLLIKELLQIRAASPVLDRKQLLLCEDKK